MDKSYCPNATGELVNPICTNKVAPIEIIRTVDVQATKHGMWELDEYDMLCCSECKEELAFEETTPYCPYCGAKMDGEDGET